MYLVIHEGEYFAGSEESVFSYKRAFFVDVRFDLAGWLVQSYKDV